LGQLVGEVVEVSKIALFPGQGAQVVGMAQDFIQNSAHAKARFEEASEVLGRDLAKICMEGPAEVLNATNNCQPALLVSSMVVFEHCAREFGWNVDSYSQMAGLSLGEITALVAAESLSFAEGVKLVEARGRFMQEACDAHKSSMTTSIGLTREEAEAIADDIRGENDILVVANINSPTQMVFSGDPLLLEKVAEKVSELGKRAIPLKVAGAFHSDYMKPADDQLTELMATMTFNTPKVPVLSNVDAKPHGDGDSIKAKLSRQIVSPVLWNECMLSLPDGLKGYEFGVGKVLSGLMRKINKTITISPINSLADIEGLKEVGESQS
jgi:[acyl-carrier-protein] S-malonyltransferase